MKACIKYFLFLISCSLVKHTLLAQPGTADSLIRALKTTAADTSKIKLLNSIAEELRNINPDSSVCFAKQALSLAEKSKDEAGKANALLWIGTAITNLDKYDEALKNLNEAKKIYEEILSRDASKGLRKLYARTCNNIGLVYYNTGDFSKAKDYYLQALKIRQEIGEKQLIASSYNNLANVYERLANYPEALKNNFAALKMREEVGDTNGMAMSYNNIGLVYSKQGNYVESLKNHFASLDIKKKEGDRSDIASSYNNIGLTYWEMKNYPEALKNYFEALKLFREINSVSGLAMTYNNLGITYNRMEKYDDALKNHFASLKMKQEIGDKMGEASSYTNIGLVYNRKQNSKDAIEYLNKGLILSGEVGYKEGIRASYEGLSDAYKEMGDYKNAYANFKLASEIKDSIFNEESSKQIAEMQTKYETEKKEQQITLLNKDKELQDAQLNRQQIIIWSVAGGFLIVLVLSLFIYKERRKSEKLLLNILPAETAKELKAHGKAKAKYYESVTVMFTDFKGFTTIAEKLSAEELVSELDFIFKKFDEIISRYNIEKIKTIGDAYMCASGLPALNSNHALEIIQAGLEIQHWMTNQNSKWQLRIGIHSGPVTAGVVGDKKFAYDIWGDTVNTASRMESSGEPGRVNVSGATYELTKTFPGLQALEKLNFIHRGKIPAKNKGEIDMYFAEKN